jgi:Protein of unknown function (DUF1403)
MIRAIPSLSKDATPARSEPLSADARRLAAPGALTVREPAPIGEPLATKRRKRPASRAAASVSSPAKPLAMPVLPRWMRAAKREPSEEREGGIKGGAQPSADALAAAFVAGAALAALDPLARNEAASFHGCWIARLSLKAAAASARTLGRGDDEAALRDAFCLRPPGGDPGPSGRLLVAVRSLAGRSPDLIFSEDVAGKVLGDPGLPGPSSIDGSVESGQARLNEILDAAAGLAQGDRSAIFAAAEAAALACRGLAPSAERAGAILALIFADAVLACRLSWPMFVPLLSLSKEAGQASRRALRTGTLPSARSDILSGCEEASSDAAWLETFCLGLARAAAGAHDLFCDLARGAERLEAAVPKLRAKGAAGAIEKILSDDAVTAAMRPGNLSDRAARRLLDRLVSLGVLKELSGRPAFRLYGL